MLETLAAHQSLTAPLPFVEKGGPVNETETDKVSLRVEFSNPQRALLALETTLGPGECSINPILYSRELNSDAGWMLIAFAKDADRLCYRISDMRGVGGATGMRCNVRRVARRKYMW